ncbi:T9SS type A sorting domain-containing protein [Candidatus Latescibacterota bacterium]
MKLFKILSLLVLFLGLVLPASAQDVSIYGSPLVIIPYDLDSLEVIVDEAIARVYEETGTINLEGKEKEARDLRNLWWPVRNRTLNPAWSPDGQWIAFNHGIGSEHLWIVSSNGGVPTNIYTEYINVSEGLGYYNEVGGFCFTHDSQELTFCKKYYDEEKGSSVSIKEQDGFFYLYFINPIYTIESINIHTKERRVITDGEKPIWSHDGRYLCYINTDHDKYLTILDTQTGEKIFLKDSSQTINSYRFTPDDSAVIFSLVTGIDVDQLFQIPITGGEPEQITFPIADGDGTGNKRLEFDISPDGEWILYRDINLIKTYFYPGVSDSDGSCSSGSNYTEILFLYNLASGATYKLFPEPQDTYMWTKKGIFSPDGTKICYEFVDGNHFITLQPHLYIKDIDLDSYVHVEKEPESFALLGNYPNPFNPITNIEYSVPNDGQVKVKVYNTSGQVVSVLKDEFQNSGSYTLTWDAEGLSSGLYFCTLEADRFSETKKMMLVR